MTLEKTAYYLPRLTENTLSEKECQILYTSDAGKPIYDYAPANDDWQDIHHQYENQIRLLCEKLRSFVKDQDLYFNSTEQSDPANKILMELTHQKESEYLDIIDAFEKNVLIRENNTSDYCRQKGKPIFFSEIKSALETIILAIDAKIEILKSNQYEITDKADALAWVHGAIKEASVCEEGAHSKLLAMRQEILGDTSIKALTAQKLNACFEKIGADHVNNEMKNLKAALENNDISDEQKEQYEQNINYLVNNEIHAPDFFKNLAKAQGLFPDDMPFEPYTLVPHFKVEEINGMRFFSLTNATGNVLRLSDYDLNTFRGKLDSLFNSHTLCEYLMDNLLTRVKHAYNQYAIRNQMNEKVSDESNNELLQDLQECMQSYGINYSIGQLEHLQFYERGTLINYDEYEAKVWCSSEPNDFEMIYCLNSDLSLQYRAMIITLSAMEKQGFIKKNNSENVEILDESRLMPRLESLIETDDENKIDEFCANLKGFLCINDAYESLERSGKYKKKFNEIKQKREELKLAYNRSQIGRDNPVFALENISDLDNLKTEARKGGEHGLLNLYLSLERASREAMCEFFKRCTLDKSQRLEAKNAYEDIIDVVNTYSEGTLQYPTVYLSDSMIDGLFNLTESEVKDALPESFFGNMDVQLPDNFFLMRDYSSITNLLANQDISKTAKIYPALILHYIKDLTKENFKETAEYISNFLTLSSEECSNKRLVDEVRIQVYSRLKSIATDIESMHYYFILIYKTEQEGEDLYIKQSDEMLQSDDDAFNIQNVCNFAFQDNEAGTAFNKVYLISNQINHFIDNPNPEAADVTNTHLKNIINESLNYLNKNPQPTKNDFDEIIGMHQKYFFNNNYLEQFTSIVTGKLKDVQSFLLLESLIKMETEHNLNSELNNDKIAINTFQQLALKRKDELIADHNRSLIESLSTSDLLIIDSFDRLVDLKLFEHGNYSKNKNFYNFIDHNISPILEVTLKTLYENVEPRYGQALKFYNRISKKNIVMNFDIFISPKDKIQKIFKFLEIMPATSIAYQGQLRNIINKHPIQEVFDHLRTLNYDKIKTNEILFYKNVLTTLLDIDRHKNAVDSSKDIILNQMEQTPIIAHPEFAGCITENKRFFCKFKHKTIKDMILKVISLHTSSDYYLRDPDLMNHHLANFIINFDRPSVYESVVKSPEISDSLYLKLIHRIGVQSYREPTRLMNLFEAWVNRNKQSFDTNDPFLKILIELEPGIGKYDIAPINDFKQKSLRAYLKCVLMIHQDEGAYFGSSLSSRYVFYYYDHAQDIYIEFSCSRDNFNIRPEDSRLDFLDDMSIISSSNFAYHPCMHPRDFTKRFIDLPQNVFTYLSSNPNHIQSFTERLIRQIKIHCISNPNYIRGPFMDAFNNNPRFSHNDCINLSVKVFNHFLPASPTQVALEYISLMEAYVMQNPFFNSSSIFSNWRESDFVSFFEFSLKLDSTHFSRRSAENFLKTMPMLAKFYLPLLPSHSSPKMPFMQLHRDLIFQYLQKNILFFHPEEFDRIHLDLSFISLYDQVSTKAFMRNIYCKALSQTELYRYLETYFFLALYTEKSNLKDVLASIDPFHWSVFIHQYAKVQPAVKFSFSFLCTSTHTNTQQYSWANRRQTIDKIALRTYMKQNKDEPNLLIHMVNFCQDKHISPNELESIKEIFMNKIVELSDRNLLAGVLAGTQPNYNAQPKHHTNRNN